MTLAATPSRRPRLSRLAQGVHDLVADFHAASDAYVRFAYSRPWEDETLDATDARAPGPCDRPQRAFARMSRPSAALSQTTDCRPGLPSRLQRPRRA